jgi:hypothetical protein
MATFAAFLAAYERQEVIVAWMKTRRQTTGWTAVGVGAPNAYQTAMSGFIGTSQVVGGVYAKVTAVYENDVTLTERTSLALVNSNAGSWYWDPAAALLYVRSTGGGDPDTYSMYAVEREITLSTTPIVLNDTDGSASTGRYYHPWISSEIGSVLAESTDPTTGRMNFRGGSLTLASVGGFWHALVAADSGYTWENVRITFAIGGSYGAEVLLKSQYSTIASMTIYRVDDLDDTSVTFRMNPIAKSLDVSSAPTPIFETSYPNLADGVRGLRKPIVYGRLWMRPVCVDTATSYGVFLIADATFQTLTAIHRVDAIPKSGGQRVQLSFGSDFTFNLTTCTVTLVSPSYTYLTHDIIVYVSGKPGGVRGYLSTFGEIGQDLLTAVARVPTSDIDTASFTQATNDYPAELAVFLDTTRTVASVISSAEPGTPSLERSIHGSIYVSREGKFTARVWSPPKDVSTLTLLRKEQCEGLKFHHREERLIVSGTRVFYARDYALNTWAFYEKIDTPKQYLGKTNDVMELYTYLAAQANAQAQAERYQILFATAYMEADIAEIGATQLLSSPMDRVLLTYSPAPVSGVAYSLRVFEFVRLERIYAPQLGVRASIWDLEATGLAKNGGLWMSSGSPTYAAASAAQREVSGFWCDSAGDPGSGGAFVGRSKWV